MSHVVLLGDSVFDNAAYVRGGPPVIRQLRSKLPPGWIAPTARRAGAPLVTDNIRDFERIKPFCNVRLRRGPEYFSR